MSNKTTLELAIYAPISKYNPKVGDFIISYGWFRRVKWFGLVTAITPDGDLIIAREGNIRLLVTSQEFNRDVIKLHISLVVGSVSGAYSINQLDVTSKRNVWYI